TGVGLNESERLLIRALAAPASDPAHAAAAAALDARAEIFEGLTVTQILEQLRNRGDADPLEAIPEVSDRQLVAQILFAESEPVNPEEVAAAIQPLLHRRLSRRQRELRASIGDAERKGDWGQVAALTAQKVQLDRQMREIGH
ncbi:MAG TPA: DNA primase, partial [Silvibacterium sp.]|nr:DNA primase [Silvibacterium sp.]